MPIFQLNEDTAVGSHRFGVYDCHPSAGIDLADELAEALRKLYVEPATLRSVLEQAAVGLDTVGDMGAIQRAIEQITEASVPIPGARTAQPQLDLARNELAEVLAYVAMEKIYGTLLPAKRIREKEATGLPSRGLDLLGLETEPSLRIVLCEVKASDDTASPPGVVGDGASSLRGQLHSFVGDRRRVLQELNWALKHASPELKLHVGKAILLWTRQEAHVVVAPLLLRNRERHGSNDYGCFHHDPGQFSPATVRFCLIRISAGIEELAQEVYTRARRAV